MFNLSLLCWRETQKKQPMEKINFAEILGSGQAQMKCEKKAMPG